MDHSCGQLHLPLSGILLSFDGIELESGSVDLPPGLSLRWRYEDVIDPTKKGSITLSCYSYKAGYQARISSAQLQVYEDVIDPTKMGH